MGGIDTMADELHNSVDRREPSSAEVLLSVTEGHAFETAVAEGKFATFEDAVNASAKELGLKLVGDTLYSREALSALQRGMEEAERGEFVSQDEIEAFFVDWEREINERTDD